MIDTRIAVLAAGGAAALTLAGCQRANGPDNQTVVGNTAQGRTVFGAPAPTPTAAIQPSPTMSPKSIMQPSVIPEPIVPPPLMPLVITVGFPEGGAALDDAARAQLDTVVASPVTVSGGPIVLRGSSDSRGSDADNKLASKHRAEAVAHYLIGKGIDKARLTLIALGEDRPIAPNANLDGSDNEDGRRKNRRVDITVSPILPAADPVATSEAGAAPPAAETNQAALVTPQ